MTLQEKIGQRLMTGFPGLEMTPEFIQTIKTHKIGNVILFRENVKDCAQLKKLCGEIQELVRAETGHSAFIAIDQEGGVVTRLREDGVNVPGAMAMGATRDPENAYKAGVLIGKELRALGPNFNFAPTVDVNSNHKNPVIGVRSYGDDAKTVGEFAVKAVQGLMEGGILCTAKHFPGHGDTDLDSHLFLPCVDKSMEELEQVELVPFKAAIDAGIPAVMTAHILFPQLEPDNVPATMSRRIMQGLLREKLGFDGIIVSDCMQMNAIATYYGTVEGTLASFKAGVDLVEITHDPILCGQAAELALKAAESGELNLEENDASVERILAFKERWIEQPVDENFDFAAAAEVSRAIMEKSITQIRRGTFQLGENPICIGCPPYRVSGVDNEETMKENPFGNLMAKELSGTCGTMSLDPAGEEIAALVEQAQKHSCAVVGTYNGMTRKGQLELIHALVAGGVPTAVVAMWNPYDLEALPESVWAIAAFEYSTESIRASAKVLRGELIPTGVLPVKM